MKRIGCGVLLVILAVALLMVIVVLPSVMDIKDIPDLSNAFQSVLCQKPETLRIERHVYNPRPGKTSYSAAFYCDNETKSRNVTDQMTVIGIAIFVVPLLFGILLIIIGASAVKRRAMASISVFDLSGMGVDNLLSGVSNATQARGSPADRLKVLKQAYDQGLITESEYEAKRQDILNEI